MGAVQQGAPNSTGAGGHCTDGLDIMCYADGSALGASYAATSCLDRDHFDCNHDSYFNPVPAGGSYLASNWNIAHANNTWIQVRGANGNDVTAPTA